MGLIPKRKQLSKFADESPILSLLYIGFIGFTVVDMMSSFSLPRGKGPFSPKAANLGAYSPNYMTRSTLSSMEEDVASLRRQIDTDAKVPDWAESKIYTAADRIDSVENYMSHRTSLGHVTSAQQRKIDKIEGELRKASKMHASQADRISQLGATTSTSTTTSSSHPPIVRESMQQHAMGAHHGLSGLGSTSTTTSTSSAHLPPAMRRRVMARTLETEVSGSHLGKQQLHTANDIQTTSSDGFGSMFGVAGLSPEMGSGWTE